MPGNAEGQGAVRTGRGVWLFSSILAAHAAVLGWIALNPGPAIVFRAPAPGLTLVQLASTPSPPKPQRSQPAKTVAAAVVQTPSIVPMPVNVPAALTEVTLAMPAEGGCDLTEVVQTAVRSDEEARSALQALPQDARSVANAIMLWDGGWRDDPRPTNQAALAIVRRVLAAVVSNASAECRAAVQAGPRLVTIAGPPDMVLAIGSGRWRWGDLVTPALQTADATSGAHPGKIEITDLAESDATAR